MKKVSVIVPCLTETKVQYHMTRAVIDIARCTTLVDFELIVVEAVGQYFQDLVGLKHLHNPNKGYANKDMNWGMDNAEGEILVLLTNDVFVKQGWLEAILECFEIPDCGIASLATSDHREASVDVITEGIWCPLMALKNDPCLRFAPDEFPSYWGDSDLVVRAYDHGYRAYRNRRIVCDHLGRATNTAEHMHGKAAEIEAARNRFIQKHHRSRHLMFRVLHDGLIV